MDAEVIYEWVVFQPLAASPYPILSLAIAVFLHHPEANIQVHYTNIDSLISVRLSFAMFLIFVFHSSICSFLLSQLSLWSDWESEKWV
jgi:hypothetical protein